MPRNSGRSEKSGPSSRADYNVSYAAVILSNGDKDVFSKWLTSVAEDFSSSLMRVLEDLYRVTIKVDVNNNCYMCTWTQQDAKHHNGNLTIISRSDDPEEAFWLNVYKVYVMYADERLPTQSDVQNWG